MVGSRPRSSAGRAAAALAVALLAACAGSPEEPAREGEPRPPVEARASVDRAVATTGDVITYTVILDYQQGYEVELPEPGAEIAGFRIVDVGHEPARLLGDRRVEERWYRLRADLVGSYVLPPVSVRYRPRATEGGDATAAETAAAEPDVVETSPIFVEVESVLAAAGEEAKDIRDIKPVRRLPPAVPWVWIAATAVAIALLATAVALWRRRRVAQAPPVPPHELAFEALRALRQMDLSELEAVRRFHFAIDEVLRAYVEGRFGLNATDLTREEILAKLPELHLPEQEAASLERFLGATERVKFAHREPSQAEIQETWERALGFVEATRPRETGTEAEGSEAGEAAEQEAA